MAVEFGADMLAEARRAVKAIRGLEVRVANVAIPRIALRAAIFFKGVVMRLSWQAVAEVQSVGKPSIADKRR